MLASTGCTTTPIAAPVETYRDILIGMVVEAPSLPPFPELGWSYQDGMYCIGESDADKLLDYGENALPLFRYELDQYTRQVHTILEALETP